MERQFSTLLGKWNIHFINLALSIFRLFMISQRRCRATMGAVGSLLSPIGSTLVQSVPKVVVLYLTGQALHAEHILQRAPSIYRLWFQSPDGYSTSGVGRLPIRNGRGISTASLPNINTTKIITAIAPSILSDSYFLKRKSNCFIWIHP